MDRGCPRLGRFRGSHRGAALASALGETPAEIWIERATIPAIVRNHLGETYGGVAIKDISPVLGALRMIKSPFEIGVMKEVGQIAGAMMAAAHNSLAIGVPEYESALAVIEPGSRKAATVLTGKGWDRFVSPMIHNLQILQSGKDTSMVHRRASVRRYERAGPVYFCFCNMAQFKQYKLGFERMFHVAEVRDDAARVQQAAIAAIRPGVLAQDVAAAANAVDDARGYQTGTARGAPSAWPVLRPPNSRPVTRQYCKPV